MTIPFLRKVLILLYWNLGFGMILAQQPFDCEGNIYLSVIDADESFQLFDMNENRAEVEYIPYDSIFPLNINAIGYRQSDNFIYGIDPNVHFLYRIDASGTPEQIAYIILEEDYFAGDISPDSRYLVLFNGRSIAQIDLDNVDAPVAYTPITLTDTVQTAVACTDIAFHPVTGVLYGYDGLGGRLITIDAETGLVDNTTFESIGYNNTIPALFFNAVGELKGIATNNLTQEAILFQFDLETGLVERSSFPDLIGDRDACSCPYTLTLETYFRQEEALLPCTEVDLIFVISNLGDENLENSEITLDLPDGFTMTGIVEHTLDEGFDVSQSAATLAINLPTMESKIDTLIVTIEVPATASGDYAIQANFTTTSPLGGKPQQSLSDNPYTFAPKDASPLLVLPLDDYSDGLLPAKMELCHADTIQVDIPMQNGLEYRWNTGDTTAHLTIPSAGFYELTISSPCDSVVYDLEVWDTDIHLDLGRDIDMRLGDNRVIVPAIESSTPILTYQWDTDLERPLPCDDCPTFPIQTDIDTKYRLQITNANGCTASDSVQVHIERPVFAPTAFSPNNDGVNDYFYLQSIAPALDVRSLKIYDRWGTALYQASGKTNDVSMGWNGQRNGKTLSEGIYLWTAHIEYPDGKQVELLGDVLLIR